MARAPKQYTVEQAAKKIGWTRSQLFNWLRATELALGLRPFGVHTRRTRSFTAAQIEELARATQAIGKGRGANPRSKTTGKRNLTKGRSRKVVTSPAKVSSKVRGSSTKPHWTKSETPAQAKARLARAWETRRARASGEKLDLSKPLAPQARRRIAAGK